MIWTVVVDVPSRGWASVDVIATTPAPALTITAGRAPTLDVMSTTADVVDNTARNRLELPVDDHLAFLTYTLHDGALTLVHTEVPEELGGRGLGGVLVQAALDKAASEGDAVLLVCPFAKAWVEKHPDAVTAIEVK